MHGGEGFGKTNAIAFGQEALEHVAPVDIARPGRVVEQAIGPFGAKPVGEPPVIPGGAAVANAVAAATGARVTELPLTPERVRRAMEESSNGHLNRATRT